jgi:PAS domain S-box-containing protein
MHSDPNFVNRCNFATQIAEMSFAGVAAVDADCLIRVWNPVVEKMTGISAADALGKNMFDLFPFLKETGDDLSWKMVLEGKSVSRQNRFYWVDQTGRHGRFDANYTPLRSSENEVIGGLVEVRDLAMLFNEYLENNASFEGRCEFKPEFSKELGSAIADRRKGLGLSQEKLAELANLHRTYISDIERGRRNIAMKNLMQVATALQLPTWVLLGIAEQQESAARRTAAITESSARLTSPSTSALP